jgi:AmmeMemoRadiSam system protein B
LAGSVPLSIVQDLATMSAPTHPRIRAVEMFPHGADPAGDYVLRDPRGLARTVVVPSAVAMLISFMNGRRTLEEIAFEFKLAVGQRIAEDEIEKLVVQLDDLHFLESPTFAAFEYQQVADYLALEIRPAAHAGGAYHGEPDGLRAQLSDLFIREGGPGLLPWEGLKSPSQVLQGGARGGGLIAESKLCGVMSPHIDFHRGGSSFAWAYDRVVTDSPSKLFVILGTAHTPLKSFYSVSNKSFDTPLGTAHTDRAFIGALAKRLGNSDDIFRDELPHRHEHSIEFQALMLQYVLGDRRDYRIVPILVGSFHPFVQHGRLPNESPAVAEFIEALRETALESGEEVCFVGGVDMAHIGQQFGDPELLDDERLKSQWTDDQNLLTKACAGDAAGWFEHVANQGDANRICGLAPMYTLLETVKPKRGELLKYDQAVADDRTSCVSFASVAFYE